MPFTSPACFPFFIVPSTYVSMVRLGSVYSWVFMRPCVRCEIGVRTRFISGGFILLQNVGYLIAKLVGKAAQAPLLVEAGVDN